MSIYQLPSSILERTTSLIVYNVFFSSQQHKPSLVLPPSAILSRSELTTFNALPRPLFLMPHPPTAGILETITLPLAPPLVSKFQQQHLQNIL